LISQRYNRKEEDEDKFEISGRKGVAPFNFLTGEEKKKRGGGAMISFGVKGGIRTTGRKKKIRLSSRRLPRGKRKKRG